MKKKEKILIGILLILLVIVGSIYINVKNTNKGNAIQKQEISKGQLSQTEGENAYVSTQSHLAEVNAQNQELTDLNTQISETTVTADRLLKGYTAYKNGAIITGTMENRGALNWNPTSSTTYNVPAGYYSGGTLNSAGAYNAGVAATKKGTAGQAQVLSGYTFTNASGVGLSGSMANRGNLNWNPTTSTSYTVPAGYYSGGTLNSAGAYNAGYNAGSVNTRSSGNIISLRTPCPYETNHQITIGIDTSNVNSIEVIGNFYSYKTASSSFYIGDILLSSIGNTDNSYSEFKSSVNKTIDVSSVDSINIIMNGYAGWGGAYIRFEGSVRYK